MAPLSYYYLLSLAFAGGGLYLLANLLTLKFMGRMVFGKMFKTNTPEYKKLLTAANKKTFSIALLINVVLIANLILSIVTVIQSSWPEKYGLLISLPVAVVVAYAILIAVQIHQYKVIDTDNTDKKNKPNDVNNHDSWLK